MTTEERPWTGEDEAIVEHFARWMDEDDPDALIVPSTPRMYGALLMAAFAVGWKAGRAWRNEGDRQAVQTVIVER